MLINDFTVKERQAVELTNRGQFLEAEVIYRSLILMEPDNHIAYANLAALCGMQGRFEELFDLLKTALQLRPNFPEAYNSLGNAFKAQDDFAAAIISYDKALQLKPGFPEACNNLGVVLKEQGDLTAAIAAYQRALKFNPNYSEACSNLGNALLRHGNLTSAIESYKSALRLKPNVSSFYSSLGAAFHERGDLDEAIKSHNKALGLNPNFSEAKYNLSLAMLLVGDYENGWQNYEWRFEANKIDASSPPSLPKCKRWNGEKLELDSNLFIVVEQGLGDMIQFARFVPVLRDQGVNVSLCAPSRLHPLIQASGVDPLPRTLEQANQVTEGQWAPLLSVPRYLKVSPTNPIVVRPYIKSTDELNAKWKGIFSACKSPVIGINWRGNREDVGKQNRNIPAQIFRKITSVNADSFLCLQRGVRSSGVEQEIVSLKSNMCQEEVLRLADSDGPEGFLEYAAVIANCDLVITTGSTVSHIAAAIGVPTWVLLPMIPDWRWGLKGDTSFWYPSMRLFRQKARGDWNQVVDQVVVALQEYLGVD